MDKFFKKFLMYLLVLSTIITFAGPSSNSASAVKMPDVIHETVESEYLASGVLYENIKRFTSKGWWNINLVRVDLTDEYSEVGGLISGKGLSNRDTVKNMVNDNKAVAGVNGDFFNYGPVASSFSELISDGEIVSLPNIATKANPAHPTFYINSQNQGNIDFFKRSVSVKSLRSNKDFTVGLVNKSVGYNATILLNKHWGQKSLGNKVFKDTVEMVVVNDVVKEIRKGQGPTTIPTNGYIVSTSGNLKNNLLNSFKVGDKVKLNMGTTPNLDNIEFAIGGGSIILKDGVPTNIGRINIKGDHPRTGLGISKDGKELLIATIDGRDTLYKGVSQEMFGAILKDLGAYNALNLDGGGSTTMAVKPVDKQLAQVVNKPSDGGERRVVNGVGVYSNAPKGELSYLKVQADDSKMFLNTSRKFSVKGFDQYHNPIKVDQNKITYSFEGVEGEVIGNKFKAKSTGTAKVIAHCREATGSMNLRVLGEVKSLIASEDKFNLEANNKKNIGILNGIDENGFKVKIYPEDVEWIISDNIGKVQNGVFHSNENIGSGIITGKIGKGARLKYLRPDGKTQVTIEYENDKPVRIENIVVSTQHSPDVELEEIERDIKKHVIGPIVPENMIDQDTKYYVNPTGRFVIGGPMGDTGLTGRKIIVDSYGGIGRHGGGAFSGKDPSKVDRSASYAARHVAKNIVGAGLADKCEVGLAYAIGVAKPVSIYVDTFGTGKISDGEIEKLVNKHFDLRPAAIIKNLDLKRPIYKKISAYGHFGRKDLDLPWERLDKVEELKQ